MCIRDRYGIVPKAKDEYALARDRVRYIGDEVAAVVAVDSETAEEAVRLIEVEYEELPAVFDPLDAIKDGAPLVHDDTEGNVSAQIHKEWGMWKRVLRRRIMCLRTRSTPRL